MAGNREDRKAKVIEVLNKARAMELHAIHQYMNQHYSLDDMDYGELAANMKLIAIDEMRHAENFAERIKELGDIVTARLFERIIEEEQAHLTYYENIGSHIKNLGDTYLAKIAGTPSSTGTASKGFVTATPAAE